MYPGFPILLGAYLALLLLLTRPMGAYLTAAIEGRLGWGPLGKAERALYAVCGVNPGEGMTWRAYTLAVLAFNALGVAVLFLLQCVQAGLPLNPQHLANVAPGSAFNTAVSFVTNTNWQGYAGETTMSYLTQMAGLTVQNFLSAATGIAAAFALMRGLTWKNTPHIGNFWADLTRVTLYVLLPIAFVLAIMLASHGMIQNAGAYVTAHPLDAASQPEQTIAMGPVASQVAIKMAGTNGGGFFNANAAHPFENPDTTSNFLQMLAIFLIPAGLCAAFGRMTGDMRQGWAVWAAMAALFVAGAFATAAFERQANPALRDLGVNAAPSPDQSGGNMEGKEARFGIAATSLFAAITTSASCGAVNGMHDSFTPLGGLVPMWLIQLGEVAFGGVGSGLYGMLIFAIIAVFVAGLMIGRTPEYLGKKIEPFEMKMAAIAILTAPLLVLAGTALAVSLQAGRNGILNPGMHGFSEILYAFSSAANNNGSAFAGLSANTPFYNFSLAVAMGLGRFGVMIPVLAIAGSLAAKKTVARTAGSLPTNGPMFAIMLVVTVLIVGALTFLPALALGPIAEQLLAANGV